MKRTNKLLLLLASVSSVLLMSNGATQVKADESASLNVTSVKEAVNKLIEGKNYTIEVSTNIGPIAMNYNMYYTENGFYDDFLGDEYGYVAVDEGVFYFDLYNRDFTASSLMKNEEGKLLTSVWENNLFYGFHKLRPDEFVNATSKQYSASEKRVKNVFLNMFHIDFGKYQYVNPVEFKVGEDMNSFEFIFSLTTGESYTGKIKNFGTTKIDVIDEYLENGFSYHQNNATLNKIIDLFSNYNYTRIIYDDSLEDYSKIAGYEMYDSNYFYTFFEDEYLTAGYGYEIGMVGIDKTYGPVEANGKTYGPYTFKGSYYCFVSENENGDQVLDVMTSLPINTDPFVPNVYNYPTFMKMFSSTQYLEESGGSSSEFYTSKLSCVNDFVSNFQLTEKLTTLGAVPTGVYVKYYENGSSTYAQTSGKETVVFSLEVSYYGALTTLDFVYTDFNATSISCITQENIDKIINDAIQSVIDKDAENGGE